MYWPALSQMPIAAHNLSHCKTALKMKKKEPSESSDTKTDQGSSSLPRSPVDKEQSPVSRGKMYWKFAALRGWRANDHRPSANNKIADKE